uniref:Staphylococcal nuclease domain-containing protein 1 n=1 Tax=Tetraselmis sp. GSL018 TaxID=582737 RepID=A0A061S7B9_9CHLO
MSSPGGWLRGVIKEVPSGDTLIIMGQVKGGPPPEKRITLSSLVAPKLGRRDGSSRDEPFAWQSREFLRKKTIGQPCVFRIDYKVEGIAREFGSVFIGQSNPPENVAFSVVAAGWAKVRGGHQQSPFIEELDRLQEQAIENQVGMHTKDPEMLTASVRDLPCAENGQGLDAMELLSTMGKGKPLPAIVEQVLNGTTLRVLLLPSFHTSTVMVCGLQSPSMGRRDPGNPEAEPTPEPFAREAKHFAECRILNREVRVVLEGVDKYNNLFGTVKFVVNDEPVDFGEQIVAVGLAKVVDWSLAMMTTGATRLREGERAAKQARAAIWHDYVPPPTANTKVAGEYKGKVLEVISGDMVVVKDPNGTEHKISLASIRAPRMGRRDDKPEPYAVEAKDFVRRNIIGREVHVKMEYDRKIGAPAGKPGAEEQKDAAQQIMHFGSITFQDAGQDGQIKTKNIAEMLVERGLAVTQSHRGDDERSVYYDSGREPRQEVEEGRAGEPRQGAPSPLQRRQHRRRPEEREAVPALLPAGGPAGGGCGLCAQRPQVQAPHSEGGSADRVLAQRRQDAEPSPRGEPGPWERPRRRGALRAGGVCVRPREPHAARRGGSD